MSRAGTHLQVPPRCPAASASACAKSLKPKEPDSEMDGFESRNFCPGLLLSQLGI
jgi:hypothetical protein